jgi:hypothetical protein
MVAGLIYELFGWRICAGGNQAAITHQNEKRIAPLLIGVAEVLGEIEIGIPHESGAEVCGNASCESAGRGTRD